MGTVSHKTLFEKLRDDLVITKSEQYAHWTLPALMADYTESKSGRVVLERDYQEVGALFVNNLSSKLARLLFPMNTPFFRIMASDNLKAIADENGVQPSELQSGLARIEKDASKQAFKNASYNQLILALKHLIITGNALLHRDARTGKISAFGLQSFVVRRDGRGNLLDCVIREGTYSEALPPAVRTMLTNKNRQKYSRDEQQVEIFTRIRRRQNSVGGHFIEVSQAVDDVNLDNTSTYPENTSPWHIVTWNLLPGEHYGRGLVEDYAGGFARLSDMSEAAALYSIEMLRVVHLVANGSGTDVDDIAAAETGEWVRGDGASVTAHESGDASKLLQVSNTIAEVVQRLAKAFMYQANTRDAERVTAYELQQEALEAENALGGVYSVLAETMQLPLAHLFIQDVSATSLEGLLNQDIKLDIMAGIPALGRSTDVQNLVAASQEAAAIIPVMQQVDDRVDPHKVMDTIYSGRSVDTDMIFKSQEQMQQEAAAQDQMAQGQAQIAASAQVADQMKALDSLQGQ